jgi:hypothetical protein
MNDKLTENISTFIVGIAFTFGVALASGTLLWLIWEGSLTAMFPNAVENGVLAEKLEWWAAVKVVWVFGIILSALRLTPSTSKKKKEKKENKVENTNTKILLND